MQVRETRKHSEAEPEYAALVAIDWGDQKHVWALQAAGSDRIEQGELEHSPETVAAWASGLVERFGGRPVAVCLEQSRGPLIYGLGHYEAFVLYPVHPSSLAKYRQTWHTSGAKDDPDDAALLLEMLDKHRDRLRRLEPDSDQTRTLRLLVEQRRKLVNEKTRQSNRLKAQLKQYFPQPLKWFTRVDTALVGELLERWPTLEKLQQADQRKLRSFLRQHRAGGAGRIESLCEQIRAAVPATRDRAVIRAGELSAGCLVRLLATLRESIAEFEHQIDQLAQAHPDFAVFDSLPGAGKALAPRLMVAFGDRRERFGAAAEMQAFSGIAPVLERSGRQCRVHYRWACPKFVRQSLHEWAGHSIAQCQWARAYYDRQRLKGKPHHIAVRALAYKWIRILFRCWKDRVPYDEQIYCRSLSQHGSPLANAPAVVELQFKSAAGFWKISPANP